MWMEHQNKKEREKESKRIQRNETATMRQSHGEK